MPRESERRASRRPDRTRPDARYVELAWIVKPHGLDGEVRADLNTDFPERLPQWPALELAQEGDVREVRVDSVRGITGGRAIVKVAGVEDRDAAEQLRGATLRVRRDDIPPPPDGEFYDFQIMGLRVVTTDGRDLGRVRDIIRTGANDVFETDEAMIPAVDTFVREISLERGEIVVNEVEGLLG